jgi:integrase
VFVSKHRLDEQSMLHTGQQDSKQQAENPDERFAQCRFLSTRCASRNGGWVFPSKRSCTGHLITVGKLFRQARDKAGLPKELVFKYCNRHDYGTRVLRETGNLAAVMKTMGHKDVRTAMRYQRPELDIVRDALNATDDDSIIL